MQVNLSKGSLQNRYFSGTGGIGGIHLPDFNDKYVFSKKKSGISDEEYRKQIREQAYEDFAKGQFQNKSEGFNRLMKSYTSEVSPDRKGIITSGLKAVSKNRRNVLENATRKLDQHDYRKKYDGYVNQYAALESREDSLEKERERKEIQYDIFSGIIAGLEEVRELPVDFNEKLFHRLVDYATVHSDGRVVFTFRNGVEVSTEI